MEKLTPENFAWYDQMISKGYAEKNESYFLVYLNDNHSDKFTAILLTRGSEIARFLDIGCGTGKYTEIIASRYAYTVGLDRSVQSLNYALKYHKSANLEYILGDSQSLPFGNSTFDTVSSRLSPHNLLEILRVLKPKGLATCMRVGEHDAFRLREVFEQQGLVNKMRQYIARGEAHSQHIVEQWKQIGFTEVESSEYEYDMHFRTMTDLAKYLSRIPIIPEFDTDNVDHIDKLHKYAEQSTHLETKTIVLHRHRYIIIGVKP